MRCLLSPPSPNQLSSLCDALLYHQHPIHLLVLPMSPTPTYPTTIPYAYTDATHTPTSTYTPDICLHHQHLLQLPTPPPATPLTPSMSAYTTTITYVYLVPVLSRYYKALSLWAQSEKEQVLRSPEDPQGLYMYLLRSHFPLCRLWSSLTNLRPGLGVLRVSLL